MQMSWDPLALNCRIPELVHHVGGASCVRWIRKSVITNWVACTAFRKRKLQTNGFFANGKWLFSLPVVAAVRNSCVEAANVLSQLQVVDAAVRNKCGGCRYPLAVGELFKRQCTCHWSGKGMYLPQGSIGQLPCDGSRITEQFNLLAIVIEQEILATICTGVTDPLQDPLFSKDIVCQY